MVGIAGEKKFSSDIESEAKMTENEAIERLKCMRLFMEINDRNSENKFLEDDYIANKMAVSSLEEIQQYRSIGTIEDCKEAMKGQQAIKPKRKVQNEDLKIGCVTFKVGTKTYWCPHCEKAITGSDHYCRWCGQAISWEKDN